MTYINAKKYIKAHDTGSPSPERMRFLCNMLGNPEKQSRFILITGSNGKTSTAEMIRSSLTELGFNVGAYLTPYISEPKETVTINGIPLSYEEFTEAVEKVARAESKMRSEIANAVKNAQNETESVKHVKITKNLLEGKISPEPVMAEILCAVAFLAFRKAFCDVSILECAGNRADPTGIIDPPLLTVICGSSFTDEQIRTCIGSVRRTTKEVVCSSSHGKIYSEITNACAKTGSRLTVPAYGDLVTTDNRFSGRTIAYRGRNYFIPSPSAYQMSNALTAIEALYALKRLGMGIHGSGIISGIRHTKLPLRFEILSVSPTIVIDCASDENTIASLVASLPDVGITTESEITLIAQDGKTSEYMIGSGYKNISVLSPKTLAEAKSSVKSALNSGKALLVIGTPEFSGRIKDQIHRLLAYT